MLLGWLEQALTYKPDRVSHAPIDKYDFKKVVLELSNGASTSLYLSENPSNVFVLFSHGNTGNVSFHTSYYELFNRLGVSYATYDYPGYGESLGTPCERSLYESGEAVIDHLVQRSILKDKSFFHFGLSLGAAVSLHLANRYPCKGLILEAPFTDTRSMAAIKVPIPGIKWLIKNRYDNLTKISTISVPTLIVHGSNDLTTPLKMAQSLYSAHPGYKELFVVDGAGHRDIGQNAGERYDERIKSFIKKFE